MKKIIIVLVMSLTSLTSSAQSRNVILNYINTYWSWAVETERSWGVPASITLAQGILESGAGTSKLSRSSFNHFGIKADSSWGNGPVTHAWDDEKHPSRFRKYSSVRESFIDHAKFLRKMQRYDSLFKLGTRNYRAWAWGLQNAGYATSKTYALGLIGLIEKFALYRYSGGGRMAPLPGEMVEFTSQARPAQPQYEKKWVVVDRFIQVEEEVEVQEEDIVESIFVHEIHERNGVRCTVMKLGEDLSFVARREDVSLDKLRMYNDLANEGGEWIGEDNIKVGSIVYLDSKKLKYIENDSDFDYAQKDESLHNISQRNGMKCKSLAKLNKDLADKYGYYSTLPEGEKVWLR